MAAVVRPMASALKWRVLRLIAAAMCRVSPPRSAEVCFVVGCGRSGTTILGTLLGRHPRIIALVEPRHLWFTIDPRADHDDFYCAGVGQCMIASEFAADDTRRRAERLFGWVSTLAGQKLIVEKTPINAFRIAWLRALMPGARIVHIVRDGRSVVRSIVDVCDRSTYRVTGKPDYHSWWGTRGHKWLGMRADIAAAPDMVDLDAAIAATGETPSTADMAAVEWIASVREARRSRGERWFHELRYEDLCARPVETVAGLFDWLGVAPDPGTLATLQTAMEPDSGHPRGSTPPHSPQILHLLQCELVACGYDAGRSIPVIVPSQQEAGQSRQQCAPGEHRDLFQADSRSVRPAACRQLESQSSTRG